MTVDRPRLVAASKAWKTSSSGGYGPIAHMMSGDDPAAQPGACSSPKLVFDTCEGKPKLAWRDLPLEKVSAQHGFEDFGRNTFVIIIDDEVHLCRIPGIKGEALYLTLKGFAVLV